VESSSLSQSDDNRFAYRHLYQALSPAKTGPIYFKKKPSQLK
jgi:hypothetical protein